MRAISNTEKRCYNCGTMVRGHFCQHCGQSASVERITFRETFQQFLSGSFSMEGPFWRTIKGLVLNPGQVYREFMQGKRKTYYKPVAFFLMGTALYIIIRALLNYDPLEGQMPLENNPRISKWRSLSMEAARFMTKNINNIMIFLALSISLMLKVFFWKAYNLAEYMVVGLYIAGFYTFWGILVLLIASYFGPTFQQFQLLFLGLYVFYASFSLFRKYSFAAIIRYFLVGIFSLFFYIFFSFGFSFLWVWLGKA